MDRVDQKGGKRMNITAKETAERQLKRTDIRWANPKEVWGLPFGIEKLDRITGGIQVKEVYQGQKVGDNDLIVLIADTGVGKSSFAGFLAQNIAGYFKAKKPGYEVRLVTLEMSAESFQDRMAASLSGVPLRRIKSGMYLSEKQKEDYYHATFALAELPIRYIDEVTSLADLGMQISKQQDGMRCGFWIIDHLHLTPGASNAENSVGALNEVVVGLTKLAQNVSPGMVLAQMNKDALRRVDKRPQKSDIRNNSSLSNAATVIFGLFREDIYTKIDVDQRPVSVPAELSILKSREGEMGTIELELVGDRMLWVVKQ